MALYKHILGMIVFTSLATGLCGFQHVVYINSKCLISSHTLCRNITWVFQQEHISSTHYILSKGHHYLTETTPPFMDLTSLAITGDDSVVSCTGSETGLAFINVTNITIQDITFRKCSSLRNSTSRKYTLDSNDDFLFCLYRFQVALYFYQCRDITMTSLVVTESPDATAVAMYNTVGTNQIENCEFTSNRLRNPESAEYPGGGGFYIEFTFCVPGDDSCEDFDNSIADFNSDGRFYFFNVTFRRNKASNLFPYQENDTFIVPYKKIHNSFGKGGGLAIVFKGNASNNSIDISECIFEENEAAWGGGLLIEFQDFSSSNNISIMESRFFNNGLRLAAMETTGGGMRVGHYVYDLEAHPHSVRNEVLVSGCIISANHALNGGGVSIFPARQLVMDTSQLFRMFIHNTTFTENQGQVGAALESTIFSLFVRGNLPLVGINTSKFLFNSIEHHADETRVREVGVGVVYSNGVPIHFHGEILFEENIGSGLAIVSTFANFSNSNATFLCNRGKYGGAISILGSAFLLIDAFTVMKFDRNRAEVHGGAIANVFIERENFKNYPNCFIHHSKPFRQPQDWGAKFIFTDNWATLLGNSIYTTSLLPCAWAGGSGHSKHGKILCWSGWEFFRNGSKQNCHKEINTDSGKVSITNGSQNASMDSEDANISTFPGREFQLPLLIEDDLGTDVTNNTVFTAKTLDQETSQVNPRFTFLSGRNIQVDGIGGAPMTLQLNSDNERAWEMEIEIQLLDCPPGYVPSQPPGPNSVCMCNPNDYQGLLHCFKTEVYITNGYWFGKTNDTETNELVTSLCLPGFCHKNPNGSMKLIPDDEHDLDWEICGLNNRKGILCGECIDGYGPSVNREDFECIPCDDRVIALNAIWYILSVYLPLFLLFVFIIVFSVRLTSGQANAFIFYAQVVSSTFDLNADSHIPLNLITNHTTLLLRAYRIPYGIFNLEFLESLIDPLCFGTNLSALDVLQLEYVIAFFPLVMIIMVVILVKIRDTCAFSSFSAYCRKPKWKFLRHWKAGESLLHAFSAFLLLSYTKFSLTSSYLVNIHPFYDAEGNKVGHKRAYYAGQYTNKDLEYIFRFELPACLILVVIAIVPLVLFGYPVVWFEKCIIKVRFLWRWYPADKVQIFLDTFQGCYKDDRRFFAGMYFTFRLTINVCYILTDDWLQQFIVQQVVCTIFIFIIALSWPYREEKWYMNYVDLFIFTNLATVNALSLYLFVFAKINQRTGSLPEWPFAIQYVLVFLPLVYMALYMVWHFLSPAQRTVLKKIPKIPVKMWRRRRRRKFMQSSILGPSEGPSQQTNTDTIVANELTTTEVTFLSDAEAESDSLAGTSGSDDDMEAMLVRAKTQNTYRSSGKPSFISPYQQWVQDAKGITAQTSRVSGLGQSRDNDLSGSVHVTSEGSKAQTTDMGELKQRHSYSDYGSTHNCHAEL